MVKLAKAMMPTKNWGDVPRPDFEVIGWDDTAADKVVDVTTIKEDMDDEIPF
jgi:hypothetical protein